MSPPYGVTLLLPTTNFILEQKFIICQPNFVRINKLKSDLICEDKPPADIKSLSIGEVARNKRDEFGLVPDVAVAALEGNDSRRDFELFGEGGQEVDQFLVFAFFIGCQIAPQHTNHPRQ